MNAPVLVLQPGPVGTLLAEPAVVPVKLRLFSADAPEPTRQPSAGSSLLWSRGRAVAVARGRTAIRAWEVLPGVWPSRVVSDPTYSPSSVASMSWTPTPRARVGFHEYGMPLAGLSAAMPSRLTAPWPGLSPAVGLFCQRWWPPA